MAVKIIALYCLNFSQIRVSSVPAEACALYTRDSLWRLVFLGHVSSWGSGLGDAASISCPSCSAPFAPACVS